MLKVKGMLSFTRQSSNSMKTLSRASDPYYDGEQYRKDGGDGTGIWLYDKQKDDEEAARAQLWREELIEEIEQKVEGLRELEEPSKKKEELVN